MNDLPNPYASPTIAVERDPQYERRTIRGTFVMDELTQRDSARGYQLRHVAWLASSLAAIPAILLVVIQFTSLADPQGLAIAVLTSFITGSCIAVAIHVVIDWSIFWHNLRQLREHPILGATGPWLVLVDEATISITTGRGQQSWPLATARRMELNRRPIVLWLERDLAVALPLHGDYQEDDYAAVRGTLRQRITHIGGLPR